MLNHYRTLLLNLPPDGEDVAEELKVVAATALNLSENVRNVMANQLAGWLSAMLFKVLSA